MEIFLDDIPPAGLKIEKTEAEKWLSEIVREAAGEGFAEGDRIRFSARLTKVEGNITIDGELVFSSHPVCDRCLSAYDDESHVPFHAVLAPLYESRRQEEREEGLEVELVREDLEFGFYEGDSIDLGELVREQALLARPMKRLCRDDCAGLCQHCGKDLNAGLCNCVEKHPDPRWEALKNIKIAEKKTKKKKPGGQKAKGQGRKARGDKPKAKG